MENKTQILLRLPKRLANHFDKAAAQNGLSRNQWAVQVLSDAIAPRDDHIPYVQLKTAFITLLLIESRFKQEIGAETIKKLHWKAEELAKKWVGLQ